MEKPLFHVQPFNDSYQKRVEELVLPIQQLEFGVPITLEEQPDLMNIESYFQRGNGNFWVAVQDQRVVGTIGVVDIGDDRVALKKMFVHRDFRGKDKGVSRALMKTAQEWCASKRVQEIILGTTAQMVGAHKFYEQHGFVRAQRGELPASFPIVSVDTVFYRLRLRPAAQAQAC